MRRLLGVGLVVAGSLVVSPAGNRGALADHVARFSALWPEQTLEPALATQLAVDDADPALEWRTSSREVAVRFAMTVLGWRAPVVREEQRLPYRFETAELLIAETGDRVGIDEPAVHTVLLQRMLRGGASGIWSVMSVDSRRIDYPDWTPRLPFSFGHVVETRTARTRGFPEGTPAVAGWAMRDPCGLAVVANPIRYWRGWTQFGVAPVGPRPWCWDTEEAERAAKAEGFPGHVVIARGAGVRAEPQWLRALFDSEPARAPILDLTATTARFGPGWTHGPLEGRAAWRRDPGQGVCPDHAFRISDPAAETYTEALAGVGVTLTVPGEACRVRETFELRVTTVDGSFDQPPPAPARSVVRGEVPRDYIVASWTISNWCTDGRPLFTISGAGQQVTFGDGRWRDGSWCWDRSSPPIIGDEP